MITSVKRKAIDLIKNIPTEIKISQDFKITRRQLLIFLSVFLGLSLSVLVDQTSNLLKKISGQEYAEQLTLENYRKLLFDGEVNRAVIPAIIAAAEGNLVVGDNGKYVSSKYIFGHIDPGNFVFNIGHFSLQLPNLIPSTDRQEDDTFKNLNLTPKQKTLLNTHKSQIDLLHTRVKEIMNKYNSNADLTREQKNEYINEEFQKEEFKLLSTPLIDVADQFHIENLKLACEEIITRANEKGIKLTVSQVAHILDVYNQSPAAAFDKGGVLDLISNLGKTFDFKKTPTSTLILARVMAYIDEKGEWKAFDNIFNFVTDQDRRITQINNVLNSLGFKIYKSKDVELGKVLDYDSNIVPTTIAAVNKNLRANKTASHSDLASLTSSFTSHTFQENVSSAIYAALPGEIVYIKNDTPSNVLDKNGINSTAFTDFGPNGSFGNRTVIQVNIPENANESLKIYDGLFIHYLHLAQDLKNTFKVGDTIKAGMIIADPLNFSGSGDGATHYSLAITKVDDFEKGDSIFGDNMIATRNITFSVVLVDKNGENWVCLPLQNQCISSEGKIMKLSEILDICHDYHLPTKEDGIKQKYL